jgi:UDP:flavonoid glycosyltransferase YjiC (YdhE family)
MPPTWPDGSAPRVFAYLADGPAAPAILNALTECAGAVCLYAPELASDVRAALDPGRFDVADTLIDIAAAGREATLFVNNGNLNTATAALLAGRAQLNVPTTAEQYVNARRVELLGAGLAAPQAHPGDIPAKLNALLSDGRYRRAAARFASKYPDTSAQEQVRAMLGDVDALCGSPR